MPTAIHVVAQILHAMIALRVFTADRFSCVGRAVVRDDEFKLREGLVQEGIQRFADETLAIVHRHSDGESHDAVLLPAAPAIDSRSTCWAGGSSILSIHSSRQKAGSPARAHEAACTVLPRAHDLIEDDAWLLHRHHLARPFFNDLGDGAPDGGDTATKANHLLVERQATVFVIQSKRGENLLLRFDPNALARHQIQLAGRRGLVEGNEALDVRHFAAHQPAVHRIPNGADDPIAARRIPKPASHGCEPQRACHRTRRVIAGGDVAEVLASFHHANGAVASNSIVA